MRIVVLGSSIFRKEKVEIMNKLKMMGLDAIIDPWTIQLVEDKNPELWSEIQKEHAVAKKKYGFIKWYFEKIRDADAILVCNLEKHGVSGYIGSNTLMEIAIAYNYDKKIFILNQFGKDLFCYDEVAGLDYIILNGNLELIK